MFLGIIGFVAFLQRRSEMPLADARGRVAGGFELFGQGDLLEGQEFPPVRDLQLRLRSDMAGDPVGQVQPRGILARQQGGAGGRTDRAGRVSVREADAVLGQLVDMGGLVELAAVAGEVGLPHVIHQDDDDVGRGGGRQQGRQAEEQGGD